MNMAEWFIDVYGGELGEFLPTDLSDGHTPAGIADVPGFHYIGLGWRDRTGRWHKSALGNVPDGADYKRWLWVNMQDDSPVRAELEELAIRYLDGETVLLAEHGQWVKRAELVARAATWIAENDAWLGERTLKHCRAVANAAPVSEDPWDVY